MNKKLKSKRQDDDSDNEEEEEDEDGDAPKKGRRKSVLKTKKKKKAKRPSETDDEDQPEDDEVKGGTSGVKKFASKFQIGNLSFSKVRGEGQPDAGIFKAGYCPSLLHLEAPVTHERNRPHNPLCSSQPSFIAEANLSFKVPRPRWYKNMMKDRTMPAGLGLRKQTLSSNDEPEKPNKPLPKNYAGSEAEDVISILITTMENLVDDPVIVHPVVRVHLVDIKTGRYLERVKRKNQKFQSATTQFERQTILPTALNKKRVPNKKCTFIPPICTLPWRLAGVRGANPEWHEQVRIRKEC